MKKHEFTSETKNMDGSVLHRIRAVREFGDVKAGDIGGWIEEEGNLSHEGDCWVYNGARVFDSAIVRGDARVRDRAWVCDNAIVEDEAVVCDFAMVQGNAAVGGNAKICARAVVMDYATIKADCVIGGDSKIGGRVEIIGIERNESEEG